MLAAWVMIYLGISTALWLCVWTGGKMILMEVDHDFEDDPVRRWYVTYCERQRARDRRRRQATALVVLGALAAYGIVIHALWR
jgi:hypothetical protein